MANLVGVKFQREKFYDDRAMYLITNQLNAVLEKPNGTAEDIETAASIGLWCVAKLIPDTDEMDNDSTLELEVTQIDQLLNAAAIATSFLKLKMQEPLVWVYDIMAKVFKQFEPSMLIQDGYLPLDLVEYSFGLYRDKETRVKLKIKILNALNAVLNMAYSDQHLDFANKDFYMKLKFDFLKENIETSEMPLYEMFFCSIVEFLCSLFEFNDNATNVSICEDLEFEKLLLEFLVNNKGKPEVGQPDSVALLRVQASAEHRQVYHSGQRAAHDDGCQRAPGVLAALR